ncbi:YpjP family protein [Ammoniphilus sp. 3BR4]|uniref:YpjP family protein n=1 Tax=Ammoniphilus sp. 3BR4 TaxID=3158265 RepID=UPI003467128B
MGKWLRKATSILVTVLTLGLVTPPYLHSENLQNEPIFEVKLPDLPDLQEDKEDWGSSPVLSWDEISWEELSQSIVDKNQLSRQFTAYMAYQADIQVQKKFGPTISSRVGEDYRLLILPKFEKALDSFSQEADEALLRNVGVTQRPAAGHGEKIFHLYDTRTGEDLVRYHVRREKPPQDGYWFSFHYHKKDDQFQHHYELGKIYWDKNTPPRWVS